MTFLKTLFSPAANKALVTLSGSVISLVALFTQVDPSTPATVASILGAIALVGSVFFVPNKP